MSKREGMGGGDMNIALMGFGLGFMRFNFGCWYNVGTGCATDLVVVGGGKGRTIAFGPFLIISAWCGCSLSSLAM